MPLRGLAAENCASIWLGPGKENARVPSCFSAHITQMDLEHRARCIGTDRIAGMKGDQALRPTLMGPSMSYSMSAMG